MKLKIAILLLTFITVISGQVQASTSVQFITLGNCYLCAVRIQDAANTVNGVEAVSWDYATETTSVTYDETVTDVHTIMQAIANSGHDTEWYEAPFSAYKTLIGTCCEYNRYLDYTNILIGYLSLMDIHVYPLSVNEVIDNNIDVYASGNSLYINNGEFHQTRLSIYSNSGQRVLLKYISGNQMIDTSELSSGQYIVHITDSDKTVFRKKILKY